MATLTDKQARLLLDPNFAVGRVRVALDVEDLVDAVVLLDRPAGDLEHHHDCHRTASFSISSRPVGRLAG